jgi:hypothetical protein
MLKENETPQHEQDEHDVRKEEHSKPNAYRVDDDNNLEEKDLKTHYLFGEGKMKSTSDPGMEGQGMGGHQFGKENLTPAGNDEANPPQNAGEDNAYFARRQPAEEHPEDSNFEAKDQQGGPGKDQPNMPGPNELPDQQKVGEDKEGKTPDPQEPYREGTADNDGYKKPEREHIET